MPISATRGREAAAGAIEQVDHARFEFGSDGFVAHADHQVILTVVVVVACGERVPQSVSSLTDASDPRGVLMKALRAA